ncbi:MAG: hypothetical protein AAF892_13900 [Cyanobacteria bacterium P01_D01_bin.71]
MSGVFWQSRDVLSLSDDQPTRLTTRFKIPFVMENFCRDRSRNSFPSR